CSTFHRIDVW
nr:immunoglobulin heavy chain junction region [Macaca mulatta]MOY21323.1 immunoglobulin heavy chain junction region [Macaca mulatta]MOY21576.1 immunoglobulin heavy chain junction region [Macaca mulatta]MOY21946.1 immunoglobulin heavy chain junction region [Macaca mulatta]MOY24882.1 immunoglobulin heavy chain junction region [Macaca mulatta]